VVFARADAAVKQAKSLTRRYAAAAVLAAGAVSVALWTQLATHGEPAQWAGKVVAAYPHDHTAFTQGLLIHDGVLYEGTGLYGRSSLRRVMLETGRVEELRELNAIYFGEGIAMLGGRLYQLTWRSRSGFIYDPGTFDVLGTFHYDGEGWGLTSDGRYLILSDGTATLRFIDPKTFEVVRRITAIADGKPVERINELEYVRGEIWANIWYQDRIVRLSPATGQVLGWIDLGGLYAGPERSSEDVLNGIAYDAAADRVFVTGKNWPQLYEIQTVPRDGRD
jgi:glutaminyl-peptide cyclotransferase